MKILAFAEYLFDGPWRPEGWVGLVCRALADRGHDVTLACDGGHDLSEFVPFGVTARRPLRAWRAASPVAFSRWAHRLALAVPHDASLSFTPLVSADASLALGGPIATIRMMAGVLNPLSFGLELLHQPWLPVAIALESSLARSSRGVRLRIGLPRDADTSAAVGYASRLPWAGASIPTQHRARARVREALGVGLRRPLILLSSVHPRRPGLDPMLRALAEARADARPAVAPVALVVGRNGYSIHAAATRAGCPDGVRLLSGTDRMAEVIDACDLVVAHAGAGRAEGTGRLIADALRRGRPALADRDAPGADLLIAGSHNAYSSPGIIVERRTSAAWREALATGLNDDWRDTAAQAALSAGRDLSIEALTARLEEVLARAAERRGTPALNRP